MCPDDTTPDPRDMMRAPDEPEFLQPRPRPAGQPGRTHAEAEAEDPTRRPPLPEHPKQMAVDIEDEEADPVGDDRPGVGERLQGDSELRRG
ncbi:MAG TPA: hypothetical protein VLJ86_06340 [Ramlibacter sp.]|nr:hypothetical protein [Ramlibacter sp.]